MFDLYLLIFEVSETLLLQHCTCIFLLGYWYVYMPVAVPEARNNYIIKYVKEQGEV